MDTDRSRNGLSGGLPGVLRPALLSVLPPAAAEQLHKRIENLSAAGAISPAAKEPRIAYPLRC
jgi:hypothetical protein